MSHRLAGRSFSFASLTFAAALAGFACLPVLGSGCAATEEEEPTESPSPDSADASGPDVTQSGTTGGSTTGGDGGGSPLDATADAGRDARPDAPVVTPDASGDGSVAPNPVPVLTDITPDQGPASSTVSVTVTLTGSNFVPTSLASINGNALATTYLGPTQLRAVITPNHLAFGGVYPVTVTNPSPGGGTSSSVSFTAVQDAPAITALSPTQANAGSAALTLTVTGTNFATNAIVAFDGALTATQRVSSTELRVAMSAAVLATGRTLQVQVVHGGSGSSNIVGFDVVNASPTVSSVAPASAAPGSPATTVTVTGTNFSGSSKVVATPAGGSPQDLATTFVNGTQIKAVLPATLLSGVGAIDLAVRNPPPGGGTSPSSVTFTIAAPVPTVATLAPVGVLAGASDFPLVVTGTGFVANSVVQVDGNDVATTWNSVTQVTATVPATAVATAGTLSITVHTPGSGTSTAKTFTVYGSATCADTTGVDIALGAPGTVHTKTLDLTTAPTSKRIYSGTCPASTPSTTMAAYRAYVVQNTLNGNVALSAWAVCTGSQDAFLSFYKRATVPTSDADRQACTGYIVEGYSPESGGSSYCPGLMKDATPNRSLSLAPCEKAVVYLQAYDQTSSSYPPPPTLKIRADLP